MDERRKLERFDLALPTTVAILDAKAVVSGTSFRSVTRDISSGGAFFLTRDPIPIGTRVAAEMALKAENTRQPAGFPQMKATGYVVRSELTGIAVCFSARCRFLP